MLFFISILKKKSDKIQILIHLNFFQFKYMITWELNCVYIVQEVKKNYSVIYYIKKIKIY